MSRIIYSLRRGTPQHGQWVLACLEGSWPHIIGEIPAQACRPVDFRNSEVVIEILDSAWEKTLRNLRDHIEEKLRAATGDEVRAVRFTIRK